MSSKAKNLLYRVLVAAVFAPAIILAVYFGDVFLLTFLLIVSFGLSSEFSMLPGVDFGAFRSAFFIACCMLIPVLYWLDLGAIVPVFVLIASTAWFLLELLRNRTENTLETAAMGVFGLVLFGWMPSLAWELRAGNILYVIFPLALVWIADTAAFFAGSLIGGKKMSPVLSPNKTWAGFAGEMFGALAVGVVFWQIWPQSFGWTIVPFAAFAGLVAVGGDLFESKIKRGMKLKDSSNAIPGHGGFWDRFDSWLFVQLFAWVFFILL
ncbi:MAG TPA: hypothetical protein ENN07_08825 [candidate division Zixibacteria bacterium]|nr:hypothetical protein [candidate division Zixibacteria bacterium]